MGQILHGCAKTTEAIRFAIQNSQESLKTLARKYSINPKTVAKWKKRTTLQDTCMGPKEPSSTVLTSEEEAMCIAFRKHTLLSLDDCLYALFLRNLIKAIPYKIHTILTDNGIQFTNRTVDKYAWMHIFDRICYEYNIEHRLTKVNHPWTNGQVERMNRTSKEATVKRFYYV